MTTANNPVILIVDDSADNLNILSELLRPQYRVLAANSGEGGCVSPTVRPSPTSSCSM